MSTLFRVPHGEYEGQQKYMGNGMQRFCVKCNDHRPYAPGGKLIKLGNIKHWACHLHTVKEVK